MSRADERSELCSQASTFDVEVHDNCAQKRRGCLWVESREYTISWLCNHVNQSG